MKNKAKLDQYRQGDVLLVKVDKIPDGLKKTRGITLAYGEKTGHAHTIEYGADGWASKIEGLAEYIEVYEKEGATVKHQEHEVITLPPGKYRNVHQFEYTPAEIRQVAD